MTAKTNLQPATVAMPAWGVCVFESHHASAFRMEVSRHPALEVFYVLDGKGTFELEGRPVACACGDVVIVPVDHRHRIQDNPRTPFSLYGVRIAPDVWRNDPEIAHHLSAGRLPRNEMVSLQVRSEVRRLLFEQASPRSGQAAMMSGLALQLLALLARARSSSVTTNSFDSRALSGLRQAVEAYVATLNQRFFEPAKIDVIAKHLGMSRRRFTELFRDITGTTWADHVRRLRVDHSKQLLRETNRSVLAIAFEAGFEDLSSFYRAFQRQEGTSPHRWRQQQTAP